MRQFYTNIPAFWGQGYMFFFSVLNVKHIVRVSDNEYTQNVLYDGVSKHKVDKTLSFMRCFALIYNFP